MLTLMLRDQCCTVKFYCSVALQEMLKSLNILMTRSCELIHHISAVSPRTFDDAELLVDTSIMLFYHFWRYFKDGTIYFRLTQPFNRPTFNSAHSFILTSGSPKMISKMNLRMTGFWPLKPKLDFER